MFARVIIAVDGADGGLDASALAAALASPYADITAARVAVNGEGREGVTETETDASVHAARNLISAVGGPGVSRTGTGVLVDAPSVAGGLHRLALERSAELIVVGSHHRRSGHLWSADRTRATLRDAPCPVAVAPQGYAGRSTEPIRSVGVGYDGTVEAREALLFARALATVTDAEISALWVVDRSNWPDATSNMGRKAIEARRRLTDLRGVTGIVVETDVHRAHDALADFARTVDILVLGSHHHGLLRSIVLGDAVKGVARRLPCPLLVMAHTPRRATARTPR